MLRRGRAGWARPAGAAGPPGPSGHPGGGGVCFRAGAAWGLWGSGGRGATQTPPHPHPHPHSTPASRTDMLVVSRRLPLWAVGSRADSAGSNRLQPVPAASGSGGGWRSAPLRTRAPPPGPVPVLEKGVGEGGSWPWAGWGCLTALPTFRHLWVALPFQGLLPSSQPVSAFPSPPPSFVIASLLSQSHPFIKNSHVIPL